MRYLVTWQVETTDHYEVEVEADSGVEAERIAMGMALPRHSTSSRTHGPHFFPRPTAEQFAEQFAEPTEPVDV